MPAEIIAHKAGAFCQLKLASGERILISCAQTGIKIMKLGFAGLFPTKTLAEWPISNVDEAIRIFADASQPTQHPLESIKAKLMSCSSIADVQQICNG